MVYRQYPSGHVALLTGRGIDLRSGKRYFELSDSNGFRHGECGNIRLARQEGLIYSAIELKVCEYIFNYLKQIIRYII